MTVTTYRSAAHALGVSSTWDSDDYAEVQAHHSDLFWELKRRNGSQSPTDIPGFLSSIQHLYDYGYSHTDISAFLGVSRERVRQWFEQYDELDAHGGSNGSDYRLWSDELECFVPVTEEELIAAANERQEAKRQSRIERKRAEQVARLREVGERLGRVPRVSDVEVVEAIGHPGSHGRIWGYPEVSYVEAHDRLWKAAGFDHRP